MAKKKADKKVKKASSRPVPKISKPFAERVKDLFKSTVFWFLDLSMLCAAVFSPIYHSSPKSLSKSPVIFLFILGLLSSGVRAQVTFENIAPAEGLTHIAPSTHWGAGVSFADFNGDGLDDLSLCSYAGDSVSFYLNIGSGFSLIRPSLVPDVSYSTSLLWADFDNDGDKDLFLAYLRGGVRLYENLGDLNLQDITEEAGMPYGLENPSPVFGILGISAADYNHDGWLDLFVSDYGWPNILMRNNGDGTFTNTAPEAGVSDGDMLTFCGAFFDYDQDGLIDLAAANDKYDPNRLFNNNGDGTFADEAESSNTGIDIAAMGIAVGDIDFDEDEDMYITNFWTGNVLFDNNNDGTFTDITEINGVALNGWCWEATFFDFDLDTDLDLYVSAYLYSVHDRGNTLYENVIDSFRIPSVGLETDTFESYSHAYGDFNDDGYLDIAVNSSDNIPMRLWKASGPGGNWLKVEPEGTASNRDGIGSVVRVYSGDKTMMRTHHCGVGYLGQNATYMHWGLAAENKIDSLQIRWPSGTVDKYGPLCANRKLKPVEGDITSITPQVSFSDGVLQVDETWDSYTWQLNGMAIPESDSMIFMPTEPGYYRVELQDASGCTQVSELAIVELVTCNSSSSVENLNASPNPAGNAVSLSWDILQGADLYQVKGRRTGTVPYGTFVTANTFKAVGGLIPGESYEWKVRARCEGTQEITPFSPLSTFVTNNPGMKLQDEQAAFNLFPNPADGYIVLSYTGTGNNGYDYQIISIDGKVMQQYRGALNHVPGEARVDVSGLTPGIYKVIIADGAKQILGELEFVKQ